ncbi:MAG TPA: glycoside hydrolase [Methylocystis sp.]|jgi:exo-beta-1,3-glucanase (GH17 family)
MKPWIYGALAASICVATPAHAAQRGVNYDPAHSQAYLNAQQKNDFGTMSSVVAGDLAQIGTLGFSLVKTFYSTYCTINGAKCVNIAQLAAARNMRLMLGVFEFPDHADWTQAQVNAAVDAYQRYPGTVVAIVVGNEDMFDWQGNPQPAMQQRIVADMTTIRTRTSNKVMVTTAQREPDWLSLVKSDPQKVLSSVTVIGANIYPFWGGSPEKINGKSVANNIQAAVTTLSSKTVKNVIVTEEGWPSCGSNPGKQDMNIESEIDYFSTWKTRAQTFDSYYFAAYNSIESVECRTQGDADKHFGLCAADGQTKDVRLMKCK